MDTTDELSHLRDFLRRLESGELVLKASGEDVTQQEIAVVRREMAFLEGVLARLRAGKAP
jgi:dihydroorotase